MSSPAPSTGQMAKQGGVTTAFKTYHGLRAGDVADEMIKRCLRGTDQTLFHISELCLAMDKPEVHSILTFLRTCLVRALVEETEAFRHPKLVLDVWRHIQAWDAIPKKERTLSSTAHLARAFMLLRAAPRDDSVRNLVEGEHTKPQNKHAAGSKFVARVWIDGKDDDDLRRHVESFVQSVKEGGDIAATHDFFNLYKRCHAKVEEEAEEGKKAKLVRRYTSGRHFGTHSTPDYLIWDVLVAMATKRGGERAGEVVRALGKMYQPDHKNGWMFGIQALKTIMEWKDDFDEAMEEADDEADAKFEAKWLRNLEKQRTREVPSELKALEEAAAAKKRKKPAVAEDEDEENETKPKKKTKYVEAESESE